MKKILGRVLFIVLFLVFIFSNLVYALRINEVELNPEGSDNGKEWLELYSQEEINLTGYIIKNNDNNIMNLTKLFLSQKFSGFLIVNFSGQWLDNSDEKVFLLDNNSIIDETPLLSDSVNDNRTWQYCNNNWTLNPGTKEIENSCQNLTQNQTNQTQQNNTNQTQQNQTQINNTKEYIELYAKNEMENGKEIEIEIKAYNLEEKYDLKVYIEDNGKIISEIYDENNSKWKSGTYYLDDIFSGTGNKSAIVKIRIDENSKDFDGEVDIIAKIRKSGTSNILDEVNDIIIINQKATEENNQMITGNVIETLEKENLTKNVIRLNNKNEKDIKTQEIWKSKTQYIKEYSLYGFALFCVVVIILLIIKRL